MEKTITMTLYQLNTLLKEIEKKAKESGISNETSETLAKIGCQLLNQKPVLRDMGRKIEYYVCTSDYVNDNQCSFYEPSEKDPKECKHHYSIRTDKPYICEARR